MKPQYIHTLLGRMMTLLILGATGLSGYGQTAPQYEIRDLGAYHGRYAYNVVEKINNPGQIAGVACELD